MRRAGLEFPMQTVIVIVIILVVAAIFLLLLSQWGSSSQGLVGGLFDFFDSLFAAKAPAAAPAPAPLGGIIPASPK